jgi:hypothetical protein
MAHRRMTANGGIHDSIAPPANGENRRTAVAAAHVSAAQAKHKLDCLSNSGAGYPAPSREGGSAGIVGRGTAALERLWRRLQPLATPSMPLDVASQRSTRFGAPPLLSRVH